MLLNYNFEIKVNNTVGIILGHLTYAASKLFNVGNYERREYKKLGFEKSPNWYDQKKRLKDHIWYKSLMSQTGQTVLATLEQSWKSFFALHKKWTKKNASVPLEMRQNEPHPPHYKKDGSHTNIKYLPESFKVIGNKIRFGIPRLLKSFLKEKYQINEDFFYVEIKRSFDTIKQIEFAYISKNKYKIFITYKKETPKLKEDNKHYISIDIGTKNLLTVYDNNGSSFIISGHSVLNTSYYFFKKIAYFQSLLDKCYPNRKKGETTKRIKRLYDLKRKRINLILHRSTKKVIDYCLIHNVSKIIIGDLSGILNGKKEFADNKEKHRYNQNIRSICFRRIYDMLSYKSTLEGIELVIIKEAYSSSCSPLSPEVSEKYADKSKRLYRGLFSDDGAVYNADSVGAYNIMRLYRQMNSQDYDLPIKGLSNPKREYIPVTDQFLNEDYINWNGKSGNVGISGRNYPTGYETECLVNQLITRILGCSNAG